jgi:hypothetical protein
LNFNTNCESTTLLSYRYTECKGIFSARKISIKETLLSASNRAIFGTFKPAPGAATREEINNMKGIKATTTIDEFEIEDHVAKHNQFFKLTHLTLDDLAAYAKPFDKALVAVRELSEGRVTEDVAFNASSASG